MEQKTRKREGGGSISRNKSRGNRKRSIRDGGKDEEKDDDENVDVVGGREGLDAENEKKNEKEKEKKDDNGGNDHKETDVVNFLMEDCNWSELARSTNCATVSYAADDNKDDDNDDNDEKKDKNDSSERPGIPVSGTLHIDNIVNENDNDNRNDFGKNIKDLINTNIVNYSNNDGGSGDNGKINPFMIPAS